MNLYLAEKDPKPSVGLVAPPYLDDVRVICESDAWKVWCCSDGRCAESISK